MTEQLLKQLFEYGGVSLVVLFAVGLALWRGVWPYVTKKIDQLLENYQAQGDKFLASIDAQRTAHLAALDRAEDKFIAELQRNRADNMQALAQQSTNYGEGQRKLGDAMNKQSDMLQQVINMVQELVADRRKAEAATGTRRAHDKSE